jgi:flagellar basal body-associated protein FliL
VPDGEDASDADDERAPKSGTRRLAFMLLPLVLIALVVSKVTVLERRPPSPAVVAAKAALRRYELDTKCAGANGMNPPKRPSDPRVDAPASPAPPATGPTLDLDSKTLNLGGTHYLKVGASLQLPPKAVVDEVRATENWASLVSQLVIDTFSGRSFAELTHDGVRRQLQHEIGYETCERTAGKVVTVYFVDFVMQ